MRRHHWERLGRAEAELLQHEIDHLDGKLYIDYLSSLKRERILKKLKKAEKLAG